MPAKAQTFGFQNLSFLKAQLLQILIKSFLLISIACEKVGEVFRAYNTLELIMAVIKQWVITVL